MKTKCGVERMIWLPDESEMMQQQGSYEDQINEKQHTTRKRLLSLLHGCKTLSEFKATLFVDLFQIGLML
jgi:hypothetical protein